MTEENSVKKPFSFQTFEDLYYRCKEAMKEDTDLGVKYLKLLSTEIEKAFRDSSLSEADVHKLYDLHTTAGVTDSKQALTYTEPKKKDAD